MFDGDKSPRESGDESPHSRWGARFAGVLAAWGWIELIGVLKCFAMLAFKWPG